MSVSVYAIRGATTVKEDMPASITAASIELAAKMLELNGIGDGDIVSIIISTTSDIRSYYPAKAVREELNITAPLFSCMEPEIYGALKLCIRIMMTVQVNKRGFAPHHVYLNGAQNLRPDLKA